MKGRVRIGCVTMVAAMSVVTSAFAADAEHATFSSGERFDARTGEALYRSICQGCHMADGNGADGAASYPALANNARLASPQYPIAVVLNGRRNMPAFGRTLDDAQVAAVTGYVRTHFGNGYAAPVTAAQVDAMRIK